MICCLCVAIGSYRASVDCGFSFYDVYMYVGRICHSKHRTPL